MSVSAYVGSARQDKTLEPKWLRRGRRGTGGRRRKEEEEEEGGTGGGAEDGGRLGDGGAVTTRDLGRDKKGSDIRRPQSDIRDNRATYAEAAHGDIRTSGDRRRSHTG